jgi:hypothetical protein
MKLFKSFNALLSLTLLMGVFQNFDFSTEAVNPPTLNDLFEGRAYFDSLNNSEEVKLNFGRTLNIFDQKLPVIFNTSDKNYYAFTREHMSDTGRFKIAVMKSTDGLNFTKVTNLFSDLYEKSWSIYDAHISNNGQEYIMAMECAYPGVGASLCISKTSNPFNFLSWSRPQLVVENSSLKSASTGATITADGKTYIKWTVVDDGKTPFNYLDANGKKIINREDGNESTYTKAIQLHKDVNNNFINYVGKSENFGKTLLKAEPRPFCNNGWDCNNLDIQDWKQEGNKFYAVYNGANFYRCQSSTNSMNNRWALAIRRADNVLGDYNESSGILIDAVDKSKCGISYPVLNKINDDTYMYFAYYNNANGRNTAKIMRSKLRWINNSRSIASITSPEKSYSFRTNTADNLLTERIEKMYVILLNRYSSESETQTWINNTKVRGFKSTALGILNSKEHQKVWSTRPTDLKIKSLYQALLLRNPDTTGVRTFESMIINKKNLVDIFNIILESKEFSQKTTKI